MARAFPVACRALGERICVAALLTYEDSDSRRGERDFCKKREDRPEPYLHGNLPHIYRRPMNNLETKLTFTTDISEPVIGDHRILVISREMCYYMLVWKT